MNEYLALAFSLGLASGLTPGPLLTYTIVATLRGGWKAGVSVGIAPLITDVPIILFSLLVLHFLPLGGLRLLGFVGGLFVIYLGMETARSAGQVEDIRLDDSLSARQEMGRGVLVNFLNPNPYLFWGTVGGPLLLQAYRQTAWNAVLFLVTFYSLLVGAHIGLAALIHRQRNLLRGVWYKRTLWVLGAALVMIGARLLWQQVG